MERMVHEDEEADMPHFVEERKASSRPGSRSSRLAKDEAENAASGRRCAHVEVPVAASRRSQRETHLLETFEGSRERGVIADIARWTA